MGGKKQIIVNAFHEYAGEKKMPILNLLNKVARYNVQTVFLNVVKGSIILSLKRNITLILTSS